LLTEARPAIAELGYGFATDMDLEVVENTERVHHLVVCTLCSCYPRSLLGSPPDWYKSVAYRSRAVVEPRKVTQEFGLTLDESVEVRVVDSTADLRYLVMPRRPAGTDDLSEEELAKLVTRDSMIGVTDPLSPESVTTPSGLPGD
jgi:nitrile hydratase